MYRLYSRFYVILLRPRLPPPPPPPVRGGWGGLGRCLYHIHPQNLQKRMFVSDFSETARPVWHSATVSQFSLLRLEKVREVEEFLYACVRNNEASVGWLDRSVCRRSVIWGKEIFIARRRLTILGRRGWKVFLLTPTRSEGLNRGVGRW